MRQIQNCKPGHFVIYKETLCQVNCMYTNAWGKHATLVEVKHGPKRMFTPLASEKVIYLGDTATDEEGNFWVYKKRDIVEEWTRNH